MEFLDPKKQKAYLIRLIIGYIMVGIALVLTTVILLYQAYGFGIKNGEVIQNGLIFVSSRPQPADIYVNGERRSEQTNTRLLMPAGQYTFRLQRDGYHTWQRAVNVEGGTVVHFDYPLLVPNKLVTTAVKAYDMHPLLATQSPDRRWLLVQNGADYTAFDVYDLNHPDKPPTALALPKGIFTLANGTHSWQPVEWSSDNRHVLLRHATTADGVTASEYIMVDRTDVASSLNLTTKLGTNPTRITLRDDKFDKYYLYDQTAKTLTTATLDTPKPQPFLSSVFDYKAYSNNIVLYVTAQGAKAGKVAIKLQSGSRTYPLNQVSPAAKYMLELAQYSGDWYVAAGSPADNRTYVYKNPQAILGDNPDGPLVPVQILKVSAPDYVAFSDNARFIMTSHGQDIAVYDAETDRGYAYHSKPAMDTPQTHPTWMDGHRLMYVSGGKTAIFDFDNTNHQTLDVADPTYLPLFDNNYKAVYSLGTIPPKNGEAAHFTLNSTALLTPQDQ